MEAIGSESARKHGQSRSLSTAETMPKIIFTIDRKLSEPSVTASNQQHPHLPDECHGQVLSECMTRLTHLRKKANTITARLNSINTR